jgi:hypothetical protein
MAIGIFEQLGWLTTRVKRLCCAIKVGALQERTIDAEPIETGSDYDITEGGIYQFYGGTGLSFNVFMSPPSSVGQTIYIVNASIDNIGVDSNASVYEGASSTLLSPTVNIIVPDDIWQFISVQGTPVGNTGLIWRAFKVYP